MNSATVSHASPDYTAQDVELSFRLLEFAIRTMCYAELKKIDLDEFGGDLQLNLEEESISYPGGKFDTAEDIILTSQMSVGVAFASTAICLNCLADKFRCESIHIATLKSLISAVRNAFSHGVSSPEWYIKPHKVEVLDLCFLRGPQVDLGALNGLPFEYSHIGGLALWYRIKDFLVNAANSAESGL